MVLRMVFNEITVKGNGKDSAIKTDGTRYSKRIGQH
jgi:hypothetical protein